MNSLPMTVREVAELVGGQVQGDGEVRVDSLAPLDAAQSGQLTFALDERRLNKLGECRAAAALVSRAVEGLSMSLVVVGDVQAALSALLGALHPGEDVPALGVHASATIAPDAVLGEAVAIGPGVLVGAGARIGAGTALLANVVIGRGATIGERCVLAEGVVVRWGCVVGNRVRIGPNSVIGEDGFGYHTVGGVHRKIPHAGNAVIEDDVEIGACSCVDRAKFGSTRVGAGTKIDNLVQVAHNVQVGPGCILVAQCGIAGSSRLGRYVVLGGSAGVRDNITMGDGSQCAAYSAVAGDVEAGQIVAGTPAGPARQRLRTLQALDKLPDLIKQVRQLETRLQQLDPPTHD
ncbi:MAG: UDP-3-O-acylglucosamine N-acyltransferase [Planctomycetes bacterium ADurb.Bin126]|nr:MAG: UDP-3-O-acylglucosamine N-acyltransferase [Planctomycetes bacterium ADurb.Bin126]HQL72385.1 UDP-3-O-(3-hydroxymyristoyl)glucosamine N-acyltransferase [Phycisphaerae bacterium]